MIFATRPVQSEQVFATMPPASGDKSIARRPEQTYVWCLTGYSSYTSQTTSVSSAKVPSKPDQEPTLCGKNDSMRGGYCSVCFSFEFCLEMCYSCGSSACKQCMPENQECCVQCTATFPTWPSSKSVPPSPLQTQNSDEVPLKSSPEKVLQGTMTDTPNSQEWEPAYEDAGGATIMMCNIPCRYSYETVKKIIQDSGVIDMLQSLHLPMRKNQKKANLGYAFAHFTDMHAAKSFASYFDGYQFPTSGSTKVGAVKLAHLQGTHSTILAKGSEWSATVDNSSNVYEQGTATCK
mmetsp:Transcript_68967/g.120754  ORF Transcript_68967/g.120754 Transcript_68967/m.120754 type:complete len:292 (-) Transcript_68967:31-906(-)